MSIRGVITEVAERHDLTLDEIRGPGRHRWLTRPRQEAMYLLWETGRYSLSQIGYHLGKRDHTTVLHGVRAHKRRAGL